jgi:AraC-like DNA-binding protein
MRVPQTYISRSSMAAFDMEGTIGHGRAIGRKTTENEVSYEQLKKLPLVRCYERAFRLATGVDLKLVPADLPEGRLPFGPCQNTFCRMMERMPRFGRACRTGCEGAAPHLSCDAAAAQTFRCFAGLTVVTSPLVIGGRHVATWIGGRVFCRKPTRADFQGAVRQLEQAGVSDRLGQIQAAFFGTRVVPADQLLALRQLLTLFAQHVQLHLLEEADRLWVVCRRGEPGFVTRAKEFVQEHVKEPITLRRLAAVVHTDLRYFRRVFREATGLEFQIYLSRLRVDKAKALLVDPSLHLAQVAYAAGFTSVPQFNQAFRKWIGTSPAEYRAMLCGP